MGIKFDFESSGSNIIDEFVNKKSSAIVDKVNQRYMDAFTEIMELAESSEDFYNYTASNLNDVINEDGETLLEYIRDVEKDFKLPVKEVTNLDKESLNNYLKELDKLVTDSFS